MITYIDLVDVNGLQSILDNEFGINIFTVCVTDTVPKSHYLEYADNTPKSQVDEALIISNQQAIIFLNSTKVRLYQFLEITALDQIAIIEKPPFTDQEIIDSQAWLEDQSLPVPACVLYISLSESITNQAAAEKIVNSNTVHNNLINQIKALTKQGQTEVMNATDSFEAKSIANNYSEQIKSIH